MRECQQTHQWRQEGLINGMASQASRNWHPVDNRPSLVNNTMYVAMKSDYVASRGVPLTAQPARSPPFSKNGLA